MSRASFKSIMAGGALTLLAFGAGAADLPGAPKVLPPAAATPAESTPVDFIFGTKLMSDYNFRGISQSKRDFSVMGYGELQLFDNFLYAGVAGNKVNLPTGPSAEVNFTGGIRPKFGPFTFDLGVIYYYYPGERALIDATGTYLSVRNTDFLEYGGKVTYVPNDDWQFQAGAYTTGNWLGSHAAATWVFGNAKYNIPSGALGFMPAGFSVSGEYGHYFLGTFNSGFAGGPFALPDYNYGNVGISYTWEVFTLDVRYHTTDLSSTKCFALTGDPRGINSGSGRSNWCGDTFVASLSMDLTASKLPGIFAPK
ncbi:TorF family putative porin [Enterovirga rhinocerotis]|uniref:Uncharacterized protein (TIGR02001 family) n=1 Tax=Enterovirga rhinocerotis TaxID=1339210 RepID=A0A4V3DXS3_9HYPH|nr:TorF family putative porin [Enterovirga rhinocerotis]TDR89879.1 uncharacterized protein (TIGR02001 family) [Enterovirga rhinocerotis]